VTLNGWVSPSRILAGSEHSWCALKDARVGSKSLGKAKGLSSSVHICNVEHGAQLPPTINSTQKKKKKKKKRHPLILPSTKPLQLPLFFILLACIRQLWTHPPARLLSSDRLHQTTSSRHYTKASTLMFTRCLALKQTSAVRTLTSLGRSSEPSGS
jgi:hypothetical protein